MSTFFKLNYSLNVTATKMPRSFFGYCLKSHVSNKDIHYTIIIVAIAWKQYECTSIRDWLNYSLFPEDNIMISCYF